MWQEAAGGVCANHDLKFYSHGYLNGREAWTPYYRRPTKRAAKHFLATHKETGNKLFLRLEYLLHCKICKELLANCTKLRATRFTFASVCLSATYLFHHDLGKVVLRVGQYDFESVIYIPSGERAFLSVVSHIVTSD